MAKMTWEQAKTQIYALLEEYNANAANLTDDDDIADRIPQLFFSSYQEMSQIKKIVKTSVLDRSLNGTTTYYREYELPEDFYMMKNMTFVDEDTEKPLVNCEYFIRGESSIVIDDLDKGKVYLEYYAFPTIIDGDTEDDFELEIDNDATIIACYSVAADILKTDPSSDLIAFRNERDRRLSTFEANRLADSINVKKKIRLN